MNKFFSFCAAAALLALTGCSENKTEIKLKEAIKAKMRDPESAQFRNTTIDPNYSYTVATSEYLQWELGGKKGEEPKIKENTYKTELVCVEANGKNAFGGYAGFRKYCAYSYGDGTYSAYDVEKKEESEAALLESKAVADEIQALLQAKGNRSYFTPAESAKAEKLEYALKQSQRDLMEKGYFYYTINIPKDSKQ